MGVFKAVTMYRTDTGKEMAVEDMESTHLMNAINHHKKQLDLIIIMIQKRSANNQDQGYLASRRANLADTIEVLENELAQRNPDDEQESVRRDSGGRRNWVDGY